MSWCKLDTDVHKISSFKVSFKCCCEVDSWLLIKNFEHSCDQVLSEWYFREKKYNDGSRFHSITLWLTLFLNKKNKNENTECHGRFIPFKSHLISKQGSLIFLLFGSWSLVRSSHPEVFCKKGVLRNFANFTRKHLCKSLFF